VSGPEAEGRARRRPAGGADSRFLRGLRHRCPRQRPREGALWALEPSPRGGGVQGVRASVARRVLEGQAAGEVAAEHQGIDLTTMRIALVDYGAGNLTSVQKAFVNLGAALAVTGAPGDRA